MIKIIVSFRLTPSYGFSILFYLYLMPLIGKGPMWSTVTVNTLAKPCDDYWWTNLLYINNFYPTKLEKGVISIKLFTNNSSLVSCLISLSLSFSLFLSLSLSFSLSLSLSLSLTAHSACNCIIVHLARYYKLVSSSFSILYDRCLIYPISCLIYLKISLISLIIVF